MEKQFDPMDSKNWVFIKNGEIITGENLSLQEQYNLMLAEEKKSKEYVDALKKECFLSSYIFLDMLKLMGVANTSFGICLVNSVRILGNQFAMEKLRADLLEEQYSDFASDTQDPQ